jgi:hypothetical protein
MLRHTASPHVAAAAIGEAHSPRADDAHGGTLARLGDDGVVPRPHASRSIRRQTCAAQHRRIRVQANAWGRVVAKQLAQPFGAVAGLVVDDLCVVGVFAFVFLVLAWLAAGFEVASFD